MKSLLKKFFTVGWNVAYRKKGESKFTVIKNNKNSWTADPFIIEYENEVYIFGEIYNYDRWNGCIGYSKLENGKFTEWKEIIIEDYHLSFPNIVKEDNDIYIYPESYESGLFYRYRSIEFPNKWKKEKVYIKNKKFVDSIFFDYKDKKFFMTYDIEKKPKKLLLYNVINDKIMLNTKKVLNTNDSEARPGGNIIRENDTYIRVAQNCEGFYGKSLKFFEFTIDDHMLYKEKLVREITIDDIDVNTKNNFYGIHTYNQSKNYEVVDLKFKRLLFYGFYGKLKKTIRKILYGKRG